MNLYLFGVPGRVGGAATKIRHLILLLHNDFDITVVLNSNSWLRDNEVSKFLKQYDVTFCAIKDWSPEPGAVALAICELDFFLTGTAAKVKSEGVRLVWSNEMMWEFKGEAEAVKEGLIDKVLFVSDIQAQAFEKLYQGVPSAITGNYVAPEDFEFKLRKNPVFTIGRLSRPDPAKYPEDFPVFYEELGLRDIRYRVMAWDNKLRQKYHWHRFGPEWELLGAQKEDTEKFLHSLDLFVYPLGHKFTESWGRAVVEAMLTGCIPVVPAGHQFHNLLIHDENGFICQTFDEYKRVIQDLYDNCPLRENLARRCAEHARLAVCNPETHRRVWINALTT